MHTADLFPLPEVKRARAKGHAMGDLAADDKPVEIERPSGVEVLTAVPQP